MELPTASEEQQGIIASLKEGNNVVVDSVAGSGKSTTMFHAAKTLTDKSILLLTYNAKLKLESRQKAVDLELGNLEIHSYHAFAVRYYHRFCINDDKLFAMIESEKSPAEKFGYDIIVVDEAQDMTDLYYRFVHKIVSDNVGVPQICVIGDIHQNIYGFKGSDSRYITLASEVFKFNDLPWESHKLSTSYRITNEMAEFINKCILNESRIKAIKNGVPVKYLITNAFNYKKVATRYILPLIEKYGAANVFLVNPSIKSKKSPLRNVVNFLSNEHNIPIFAPVNDEESIDKKTIEGKLVLSTFHQTKGLERKVVVVFAFDEFYFNYGNNAHKPKNYCPNDLYVALTRATDELIVIHNWRNGYMPFMETQELEDIVSFPDYERPVLIDELKSLKLNEISVTELVKRLTPEISSKCMNLIEHTQVNAPGLFINVPVITKQGNLHESVSEITGTAIPQYYQLKTQQEMVSYDKVLEYYQSKETSKKTKLPKELQEFFETESSVTPEILLMLTNVYCGLVSGYHHKINQIKDYTWLNSRNLKQCCKRLDKILSENTVYERRVGLQIEDKKITGLIDSIDIQSGTVWEFKCVQKIEHEHVLQLVVYAYMLHQKLKRKGVEHKIADMTFKIMNILSEETLELKYDEESFRKVVEILLNNKFHHEAIISDVEFLERTSKLIDKVNEAKYFVFDTETTGLPERIPNKGFGTPNEYYDYKMLEKYEGSRIIQICWAVCDKKFNVLEVNSRYILCDTKMSESSKEITGLNEDIIKEKGVDFQTIAAKLRKDLLRCNKIVAHNAWFDISILRSECYRRKEDCILKELNLFVQKGDVVCTLAKTRDVGKNRKVMNLDSMYEELFKTKRLNSHDAKADVVDLAKCLSVLT